MIILGIETSCDETGAAVLEQDQTGIHILSNMVASSASIQTKYGGVIPEQAAREQIKSIIPVIDEALSQAFPDYQLPSAGWRTNYPPIDAIAVTYGPGLIGSLLVGVETAKTLAIIWQKPLIPVNHLLGHFYANWVKEESRIESQESRLKTLATSHLPKFPIIGLLASGGHTDLVLFTDHGKYKYLGGTRDDAAGECFDKCARLLGLPYPGGPEISRLAEKGDPTKFKLPVPMKDSKDFDFSFSGLKTAVSHVILGSKATPESENDSGQAKMTNIADLAASIEQTIITSLTSKIVLAIKKYRVEQIMIAGGVAANQKLVNRLQATGNSLKIKLHIPPPYLCTDNGAMIASAGFFSKPLKNPLDLQADPNLSLGI